MNEKGKIMNRKCLFLTVSFLLLLLFVPMVSACTGNSAGENEAAPALPDLDLNDFEDVVSAKAIIVPQRDADLSFKTSGRVQEILVEEGEAVTAGQNLARIDTRDLELAVMKAQAGFQSAQANLEKLKTGARPQEIAAANAAAEMAKARAAAAQSAVNIAKGNLAAIQAEREALESAVQVAEGNIVAAQATLASANAQLRKLLAGPTDYEIQIADKRVEMSKNDLFSLQKRRDMTRNVLEGEIGAAENAVSISELQLAELKEGSGEQDIAIARADVSKAQSGIQIARAQLSQASAQVSQADARVLAAEAQVEQALAEADSAAAQADQAAAELELITTGTRSEDITAAEASLLQAEAALTEVENALDDAVLKAPYAGTIGSILLGDGEHALPQMTVMKLGDLTRLQAQTEDLSEVDVSRISEGQEASVIVDALDGALLTGTVSQIASLATDRRGDKVYTVSIDLEDVENSDLRWGMSAFVEIDVR